MRPPGTRPAAPAGVARRLAGGWSTGGRAGDAAIRPPALRLAAVLVPAVVAVALAGCSGAPVANSGVPAAAPPSERLVFVVVGGNETEEGPISAASPGRSWAHQVFSGLPPSAVLLDFSDRGATARSALDRQVPRARDQRPTVAAVWLGAEDEEDGTPVEAFTASLQQVVDELQRAGASRVLLLRRTAAPTGSVSSTGTLGTATGTGGRARYAAAVDDVAARTQAVVVPLPPEGEPLAATAVADAVRRQMPA